jgi:hypothetical protein
METSNLTFRKTCYDENEFETRGEENESIRKSGDMQT